VAEFEKFESMTKFAKNKKNKVKISPEFRHVPPFKQGLLLQGNAVQLNPFPV